jgi:hypothetical protein
MHIDKVWAASSVRTGEGSLIASVVPSEARTSPVPAAPQARKAAMLSVEPVRTASRSEKPKRCCSPGAIN